MVVGRCGTITEVGTVSLMRHWIRSAMPLDAAEAVCAGLLPVFKNQKPGLASLSHSILCGSSGSDPPACLAVEEVFACKSYASECTHDVALPCRKCEHCSSWSEP